PIDANWLDLMFQKGVMKYIDAVGIHGFPGVFDANWEGWEENLNKIKQVFSNHKCKSEIWITEAGFSTWQYDERRQLEEYLKLTSLNVGRFYWYGLKDLDPSMATVDGFHLDEREYHFGMKHSNGNPKMIYRMLEMEPIEKIKEKTWMFQNTNQDTDEKYTLITGGSGFIGTNVAQHYLLLGKPVMIFDNLSKPGVEQNLQWLIEKYGKDVKIEIADIRNEFAVKKAVGNAEQIFHFAAQVALTTSIIDPKNDFDINAMGTLNILNAMTKQQTPPSLVFTSSNKVYGQMEDLDLEVSGSKYLPSDGELNKYGISENRKLEFHSPYGCSKGTADQYVLDFARTFALPATAFRLSCVYGPHQYGTEDQGWVAHFMLNALNGKPLNIYGDGKQVRDLLYVEDLVEAFILAQANISNIAGQPFNIGGGPENALSLINVLEMISKASKKEIDVKYSPWRERDQKYYVSDIRKFELATGWLPKTGVATGLEKLYNWLKNIKEPNLKPSTIKENF
ncbi:MAG: GDP-mannose 4,6-dehydratase, partial [Bacteroidetes bacterium]|nr:GDP-mannose 4,6-dehydratase [Bacteroidota bacterium]